MPEALQSHCGVSFNSKIDPFSSTLVLHAFEHIYSPKKLIPRQTHVETQTLLQSSVTFLLLSIWSVLLACALTSCCLPMCHKFIIVLSRHYFLMPFCFPWISSFGLCSPDLHVWPYLLRLLMCFLSCCSWLGFILAFSQCGILNIELTTTNSNIYK